ncbi:hypothetical protein [Caballeronia sp. J97]|uniref:hypothetical protein n=1 Tax=Caballeronia sp. J97 TaxID=2805429 RepID=UPI0039F0872D
MISTGVLNVGVSFGLAFTLAPRSRRFGPRRTSALRREVGRRMLANPLPVLFPPRRS